MSTEKNQNAFIDHDYEVPSSGGRYTKFSPGEKTRLRILTAPEIGWKIYPSKKGDKVQTFKMSDKPDGDKVRHFWAMVVLNYTTKRIELWECTQSTLQKKLLTLARDEEWGSPLNYDINVTREGSTKEDTKYDILPSAPKKLTEQAKEMISENPWDLQKIYAGEDVFGDSSSKEDTKDEDDEPPL